MKPKSPPAPHGPVSMLARLRGLPAGDWLKLGLAAAGLPLNALGVRLFGLRPWMAFAALTAGSVADAPIPSAGLRRAEDTWRLVDIAKRHGPYHGNCLSGSLTLLWLLRWQGLAADLRIGVRKHAGRFEAHAWIEYEGTVINDRPDVGRRFDAFKRPINSALDFV